MKKSLTITTVLLITALGLSTNIATAKGDDFGSVVKLIERFYHVKHQSIPLLARASMKAVTTAMRVKGGEYKRLAEAGSAKVVFFEDQDFDSRGSITSFKTSLTTAMSESWSPLIQTLAPKDEEQTYIFVRDAGAKFNVLVVTIERREAVVVQVDLKPDTLAKLLRNPDEMGKEITSDATRDDN